MVWPGVLGVTALNKILHSERNKEDITNGLVVVPSIGDRNAENLPRKTWEYVTIQTFFSLAFCASFVWYWFPDFIMTCLSYFTFPCRIISTNTVVNQVFEMTSRMGLM